VTYTGSDGFEYYFVQYPRLNATDAMEACQTDFGAKAHLVV
jgi:hypothetical protein